MEETEVTLQELQASLPQLLAAGGIERVYIRGDSLATYGTGLQVMAITLNSGVPWSLIAEPYAGER
jgi:biopolymer transport protein ExbD